MDLHLSHDSSNTYEGKEKKNTRKRERKRGEEKKVLYNVLNNFTFKNSAIVNCKRL